MPGTKLGFESWFPDVWILSEADEGSMNDGYSPKARLCASSEGESWRRVSLERGNRNVCIALGLNERSRMVLESESVGRTNPVVAHLTPGSLIASAEGNLIFSFEGHQSVKLGA